MSKKSEIDKKLSRETKLTCVKAMGGSCASCGYNKCMTALAFHHLNPLQKEEEMSALISRSRDWKSIVNELKKCILLCHNCHNDIHYGIKLLPEKIPQFDKTFENYQMINSCLTCGEEKLSNDKYCKNKCAKKNMGRKINWDQIDLIKELQNKSIVQVAGEIGCSNVTILKRLKKLNLTLKMIRDK